MPVDSTALKASLIALTLLAAGNGDPTRAAEHIATEHFAALPSFGQVQLSPDGRRVAAVVNVNREGFIGRLIIEHELETGAQELLASLPDGQFKLNWIRWASDRHLLISVRTRESSAGTPFTSTRLLVADRESDDVQNILSRPVLRRADWIPQFQDRVVDILPEDDEHILLQADMRQPNTPDVYRINLVTGTAKRLHKGRFGITEWMTDRQHRVRLATHQDDTTLSVLEWDVDGKNRRTLWHYEALTDDAVYPMGFAADPNVLYINAYYDGRLAVYRVNLTNIETAPELVFADDALDVSSTLVYSPVSGDVVGIRTGIGDAYEFWSDEHSKLLKAVNRALPDYFNSIVGLSRDEQRLIFLSESPTNAGTYYLLDRSNNHMSPIAQRYRQLPPEQMAEKKSIFYEARDGTSIQAFVTLPKDAANEPIPAIIYPHGGPISFDSLAFDYWAQLFANRGYAVMQMNFRGSAGYGYDFMAAGFQNWGLNMQDDVADATAWLINEGIADPERICIVGASYGGYAALMGAAKTPELFRCAVSFAGVSDLAALVSAARRYVGGDIAEKQIGSSRRDLKARSPINLAEQIDIPVLLIHGSHDVRVRVRQSRKMHRALSRLDKDVTYIEQEKGDHHLSTNEQRLEALLAIERFLAKHLD